MLPTECLVLILALALALQDVDHQDCSHFVRLRSQRAYLALALALQDVDHQDRRHLDRLRRQHLRLRLHRPPLPTGSMQGGQRLPWRGQYEVRACSCLHLNTLPSSSRHCHFR